MRAASAGAPRFCSSLCTSRPDSDQRPPPSLASSGRGRALSVDASLPMVGSDGFACERVGRRSARRARNAGCAFVPVYVRESRSRRRRRGGVASMPSRRGQPSVLAAGAESRVRACGMQRAQRRGSRAFDASSGTGVRARPSIGGEHCARRAVPRRSAPPRPGTRSRSRTTGSALALPHPPALAVRSVSRRIRLAR